MKKKQLICSALAAAMLLGSAAPCAGAAQFPDSVGHWGASAIDRWSNYGVVVGAYGQFNPDASITRGEMASIIAEMMGLEEVAANRYPDLNGGWYSTAMLKCVAAGIMTGDDHGQMRPYDNITGAEIAVMLTKALDLDATNYSYPAANTGYVKPWAQGYVNALASRGISIGNDGGIFEPMQNTSRAAVVSMFDRAISTYVTSPGTYTASGLTIINTTGTVTLRGNATGIIVTNASERVKLTLDDTRVTGTVDLRPAAAQLTATDADISGDITVQGAGSRVSLTGSTEAGDIILAASAEDSTVSLARNTSAGTIATSAPETELSISGKVDSIDLKSGASSSSVEVLANGAVTALSSAANKVTISGDGSLKRATISGNSNSIDTPDTTVKVQSGASGTRVDGALQSSGSSTSTSSSSSRYTITYRLATTSANAAFKLYDSKRVYRNDYASDLRVSSSLAPEGYVFAGWYTSSSGKKEFDFDTKIRDDYTLYGFWTKAPATVVPTPTPTPKPEEPGETEDAVTTAKAALKDNLSKLNAADDAETVSGLMTVNAGDGEATVTFASGDFTLTAEAAQTDGEDAGENTPVSAYPAMQALASAFELEGWTATVGEKAVSANALVPENASKTGDLANTSVTVTLTQTAATEQTPSAQAETDAEGSETPDSSSAALTFNYTITYRVKETPPSETEPPGTDEESSEQKILADAIATFTAKILENTFFEFEGNTLKISATDEGPEVSVIVNAINAAIAAVPENDTLSVALEFADGSPSVLNDLNETTITISIGEGESPISQRYTIEIVSASVDPGDDDETN